MNLKRGEYPIKLRDVEFTLRFDMNAFAELEAELNMPLTKILKEIDGEVTLRFLRAALFVGLSRDRRMRKNALTIDKAGALITFDNLEYVGECILTAIHSALTGRLRSDEPRTDASKPSAATDVDGGDDPLDCLIGTRTEPLHTVVASQSPSIGS